MLCGYLHSPVFGFTPEFFGGYARQRFVLVTLLGVLVTVSILFLGVAGNLRGAFLAKAVFPVFFLSLSFILLAVPFASRPYAFVEPAMYATYFLAVVLVAVVLQIHGEASRFTRFLVMLIAASCFLYGFMSINVYLFALYDGVSNLVNFLPWGFVNIRYWSHIATWFVPLLPLAVLVGPLKEHRSWRVIVALGAGLWWWIIFLSASRGSALGLAFGVVVATVFLGRRILPWVRLSVIYLVIGVLLWLILSVAIPSLLTEQLEIRSLKTGSSGRVPLFTEAWRMSLQNFPFGMGPQSWLTHEVLTDSYAGSRKFGHPHNMYLMWAAEYGWLLILAFVVPAVQAIRNLWRRRMLAVSSGNTDEALMLAGFTASVSAALFHAGVSAVFMAPGSMLVGLFVLIGFWSLITSGEGRNPDWASTYNATRKQRGLGFVLASITLVVWIAWFSEVQEYYDDMRADELNYHQQIGEGILPRFWFHGNFPRRGYD